MSLLQFSLISFCDCKHRQVALTVCLHRPPLADELASLVVGIVSSPAFCYRLHLRTEGAELSSRQECHGGGGGVVGGDGANLCSEPAGACLWTQSRRLASPHSGHRRLRAGAVHRTEVGHCVVIVGRRVWQRGLVSHRHAVAEVRGMGGWGVGGAGLKGGGNVFWRQGGRGLRYQAARQRLFPVGTVKLFLRAVPVLLFLTVFICLPLLLCPAVRGPQRLLLALLRELLLGEHSVQVVVWTAGMSFVLGLLTFAAGEEGGAQHLFATLILPWPPQALLTYNQKSIKNLTRQDKTRQDIGISKEWRIYVKHKRTLPLICRSHYMLNLY